MLERAVLVVLVVFGLALAPGRASGAAVGIPEPAALGLLGIALAGLGFNLSRRNP